MYYPNHGFISSHFIPVPPKEWKKSSVTACKQKVTNLLLWSPDQSLDYFEVLRITQGDFQDEKKTIDQVSDWSVAEFYQTLKGKEETCFVISVEKLRE